ncbi:3-hydroxyacyl-CoA dehydrogenase (plasmid) [Sphingomonas panacis]|uniref:3-hydroxyacyl-CoA dehydrogenase n=1 Tax=Sphingomonas panacis TaxID=1560345 RepID=A0A1B3ZIE6_9SPHN|nr:SDR family NAD(P)-dependent oxidoreductase [Sphingomonas panacis]AOH87199.1 3-hydroxyacyl-CoA dehydrogenase [Sphingomonas panacis]
MSGAIDLHGRVAIVTGAGRGLGHSHARALAARGASVVVSDLDLVAAEAVCADITAGGGDAMACGANVTDVAAVEAMCAAVKSRCGRIDILVNNAGIVRDKSFAKMDLAAFSLVLDVHLRGAAICTMAVWPIMRAQKYGRVIFTTSPAGLYGNFGQANYAAAKMGLVGLMQTLSIEGLRDDIRVNCLSPVAATAMTDAVFSAEDLALLDPALVSPAVVALASQDAPTRAIVTAGAGCFGTAHVTMSPLTYLGDADDAAELVLSCVKADASAHDTTPSSAEAQWLAALPLARSSQTEQA